MQSEYAARSIARNDTPNTKWKWGLTQQKAFDESKALLVSSDVLVHYNPELPIILSSDASPYGIGSVLSHRLPDGSDKPIAYASRSLSTAEKSMHSWRRRRCCLSSESLSSTSTFTVGTSCYKRTICR